MVAVTESLTERVALACRILASEGYADLTLGHVSAREPGESVIEIKRRGVSLEEVTAADVRRLSLDDGAEALAAPDMHLEAVLHTEVYGKRPDVNAVVHGHPTYATAFAASDARLEFLTHDAVLFADGLPVFDETVALITDESQAHGVARALGGARAVLMRNHGVLVVGKSVPWAVLTAVTLERALRMQVLAGRLGPLHPMPEQTARRMVAEKYQDSLVDEYWSAWVRRLDRAERNGGRD